MHLAYNKASTQVYAVDLPGVRYFQGDYREFHPQATADSTKQNQQFLAITVGKRLEQKPQR